MAKRFSTRAFLPAIATALVFANAAAAETYVVLAKDAKTRAAARAVADAGGSVTNAYGEIGVLLAESKRSSFAVDVSRDADVALAASAAGPAFSFDDSADILGSDGLDLGPSVGTAAGPLANLQWNMRQIRAPEAHAATRGSRSVVVGAIDSGIDFTHPNLRANVDFARSASCETGSPVVDASGRAWDDNFGHGTSTSGLIAAASNGSGIVGVAPNVKIAAIKVANGNYVDWRAVVCAFVWAGRQRLDVTNSSFSVSPSAYFCRNSGSRAIVQAVERAVRYAVSRGVTVVASAGNENVDLAHPPRGNECPRLPTEVPGVITVSANGALRQKAFYSNYGVGAIDVTAPGGDPVQAAPTPYGTVVSTWPAKLASASRVIGTSDSGYYRVDFGTSFAAPHVAGVAALVASRSEDRDLRPGEVEAILQRSADREPCPPEPFAPVVGAPLFETPVAFPADCDGGEGYNGFYGHGQVDALRAVEEAARSLR